MTGMFRTYSVPHICVHEVFETAQTATPPAHSLLFFRLVVVSVHGVVGVDPVLKREAGFFSSLLSLEPVVAAQHKHEDSDLLH